ncbi:TAXI family TRAP transporter solute-binding subunit [Chloroflexota bacterium]
MKKKELRLLLISVCLVLVLGSVSLVAACGPAEKPAAKQANINMGGGSIGGSGNQVANAYAGILDHFMGIKNTTVLTYPMQNIAPAVHNGDIDIGISNSSMSWDPWHGTGQWEGNPHTSLREIQPRSASALQIYVKVDSPIKTFRDLIGKRVCPGTQAMGPEELMVKGSTAIGLDWHNDFDLVYMGHKEGGAALIAGKIAAYMGTGAPPQPSLMETDLVSPLRLVGFTDEDAAALATAVPGSVKTSLPPKYYHMDVGITTVGFLTQTLVRYDYGRPEVVYGLAKYTLENPDFVGLYNKAFQRLLEDEEPGGYKDSILSWPSYTKIPLHSEVVRYFQEIGWVVPEGRIPPEMK